MCQIELIDFFRGREEESEKNLVNVILNILGGIIGETSLVNDKVDILIGNIGEKSLVIDKVDNLVGSIGDIVFFIFIVLVLIL